jgi:hypothetical protein
MQMRTKIKAAARENDAAGKFQTDLTPNETLEGDALIKRWAEYSRLNAAQAQTALVLLKGFILDELAKGNKLDFELVSFYPRLSGALSSRDSSPDAEGLYVRVAKGRIVGYAPDLTEVVFDEEIARGTYVLAFYTRCGHGDGYRVVRVSRKVRAVAP